MGAPTSSYATAGIILRVSGALKPQNHDKVETPSMGLQEVTRVYFQPTMGIRIAITNVGIFRRKFAFSAYDVQTMRGTTTQKAAKIRRDSINME
jgi:hypothetical protein